MTEWRLPVVDGVMDDTGAVLWHRDCPGQGEIMWFVWGWRCSMCPYAGDYPDRSDRLCSVRTRPHQAVRSSDEP